MKFLQVSMIETDAPAWINPALVESVQPRPDGGAFIYMVGASTVYEVDETPEALLAALKKL